MALNAKAAYAGGGCVEPPSRLIHRGFIAALQSARHMVVLRLEDDMSTTRTLRVMLVEDHLSFRQVLAFLLGRNQSHKGVARWWGRQ